MEARLFPPHPRSASEARRWVRAKLAEWGRADLADDVELCVGEIVSNALRITTGDLCVVVMRGNGTVRIEVHDELVEARPKPGRPQPLDESGRGLVIVSALAKEWGLSLAGGGKAVWFEVA